MQDAPRVSLRDVTDADVEVFFRYQNESGAGDMAAVATRDRDAFFAHWRRIRATSAGDLRTIVVGDEVAGNVVSWLDGSRRFVGYWIGKAYWGRGIATAALRAFLDENPHRPLHAWVAAHNTGSIRVLEKCGFVVVQHVDATEDDVEEFLMELSSDPVRGA